MLRIFIFQVIDIKACNQKLTYYPSNYLINSQILIIPKCLKLLDFNFCIFSLMKYFSSQFYDKWTTLFF